MPKARGDEIYPPHSLNTQRGRNTSEFIPQTDTYNLTQSANQHTHTFNFLFIKTYLKFLKTLLHISVIRPSSGSL